MKLKPSSTRDIKSDVGVMMFYGSHAAIEVRSAVVAAWNSYHTHFPDPLTAAEQDKLGEAILLLARISDFVDLRTLPTEYRKHLAAFLESTIKEDA